MNFPKVLTLFLLSIALAPAATIVTLDTSPLDPTRTYYLDFQLADGDGVANNTVSLSLISFGGGSGTFPDTTLSDAAFFDQQVYDFLPGSEISFSLDYTTNFAGVMQDTFSWAVLDESFVSVVDNGLLASLVILLDGSSPETFPAIEAYNFIEPVLTQEAGAVPEPGTILLAALGLAGVAGGRAISRRGTGSGRRPAPRA